MHTLDSSLAERVQNSLEQSFLNSFTSSHMSIIKSGNVYLRHRVACVLIKQSACIRPGMPSPL